MGKENILDIISSIIIFVVISLLTFLGVYGNSFFRDFSIIFDGGYRIFIGMKPFIDFSLFPVPIPFYLQAFFNNLFGPNLIAMGFHSIFLSATLSIIFYFICKKHFSRLVSILMAIAFYYSFIGILILPWYNQIAFFFFILNFFLIYFSTMNKDLISSRNLFLVSSILTLLTVFSKMEVGMLQFILLGLYFLIFYYNKRKDLFKFFVVPYLAGFIILTGIIKAISIKGYGFSSSLILNRLSGLFSIITLDLLIYSFVFYILIFVVAFSLGNINKIKQLNPRSQKVLGLIFLLNLFSLGILLLTGLPIQNRIFALPLNLFLIYLFFKRAYLIDKVQIKKKTIKSLLVVFIFLILISQFVSIANYQLVFFNSPTKQFHAIFSDKTSTERETFGCFKGALFEQEHFQDLQIIREYIVKNDYDFVVTGEYSFLYCDYRINPPKKLPLWLHQDTTFDLDDFENIKSYFNETKPNLVIEQIVGSKTTRQEFRDYLIEIGYKESDQLDSELSDIYIYEYVLSF